jgi:hypothetical protein
MFFMGQQWFYVIPLLSQKHYVGSNLFEQQLCE